MKTTTYNLRGKEISREDISRPLPLKKKMLKVIKSGQNAGMEERRALVRLLARKWNVDLRGLLDETRSSPAVATDVESEDEFPPIEEDLEMAFYLDSPAKPAVAAKVVENVESENEFPLTEHDYEMATYLESIGK
jgi:hypothetical protein